MKKIASVIIMTLAIAGGALWFITSGSLNEYIKQKIESVGLQVTEQKISVASVNIRLTEGAGTINDFRLPNPDGYTYPNAFSLKTITLDINVSSLTDSPIVIDQIIIKNPEVFVELQKSGQSNIKDLLDIIKKNTPDDGKTKETTTDKTPKPLIRVKQVVLAGTLLSLDLSQLGNKEHQLTLPNINLKNIGGTSGIPADLLGIEITKQALSAIWREAKSKQKEEIKGKAIKKLKDKALEKLGDLFK